MKCDKQLIETVMGYRKPFRKGQFMVNPLDDLISICTLCRNQCRKCLVVCATVYVLGAKHGLRCAKRGFMLCADDPWIVLCLRNPGIALAVCRGLV